MLSLLCVFDRMYVHCTSSELLISFRLLHPGRSRVARHNYKQWVEEVLPLTLSPPFQAREPRGKVRDVEMRLSLVGARSNEVGSKLWSTCMNSRAFSARSHACYSVCFTRGAWWWYLLCKIWLLEIVSWLKPCNGFHPPYWPYRYEILSGISIWTLVGGQGFLKKTRPR